VGMRRLSLFWTENSGLRRGGVDDFRRAARSSPQPRGSEPAGPQG
jgi:hypothetical protein